ncbi:NUDIX domain-containing protein [Candidatus Saccharibacteria bacterium]|nr:NUDIX domain-containing protein [Candidatus Saccharibacteria bacterium]
MDAKELLGLMHQGYNGKNLRIFRPPEDGHSAPVATKYFCSRDELKYYSRLYHQEHGFMVYRGGGLAALRDKQGNFLVYLESRGDVFHLPGGIAKPDEKDLVDTALRELYEELSFIKIPKKGKQNPNRTKQKFKLERSDLIDIKYIFRTKNHADGRFENIAEAVIFANLPENAEVYLNDEGYECPTFLMSPYGDIVGQFMGCGGLYPCKLKPSAFSKNGSPVTISQPLQEILKIHQNN